MDDEPQRPKLFLSISLTISYQAILQPKLAQTIPVDLHYNSPTSKFLV